MLSGPAQCQLDGSNTKSIFFGSFYRPKATDSLGKLGSLPVIFIKMGNIVQKNRVILAGDVHAPDINWPNLESSTYLLSPSEKLLEKADEHVRSKTTC